MGPGSACALELRRRRPGLAENSCSCVQLYIAKTWPLRNGAALLEHSCARSLAVAPPPFRRLRLPAANNLPNLPGRGTGHKADTCKADKHDRMNDVSFV